MTPQDKEIQELRREVERLSVLRDKGEWIPKEDSFLDIYYECSCCGGEFYLVEGTPDMNDYFFCPNCGADMREE